MSIDNNEVLQGSTDAESGKIMDELQAYRDTCNQLWISKLLKLKLFPVGKSAMEDQAGNKVLVIGEGESANADQSSTAPSTTDPSTWLIRQHHTPQPLHQFRLFPVPSQSSGILFSSR